MGVSLDGPSRRIISEPLKAPTTPQPPSPARAGPSGKRPSRLRKASAREAVMSDLPLVPEPRYTGCGHGPSSATPGASGSPARTSA